MTNLIIKSGLALIIFFSTLIGGLLPLIWRTSNKQSRRIFFCGEYFSRGIFFGGGLIHLLPDAEAKFNLVMPAVHYPVITAICAFTIYALQFIEQGLVRLLHLNHQFTLAWATYVTAILISIHSIILGAALGVEDTLAGVLVVFFAIIAHKMAESFALGVNLKNSPLSQTVALRIMLLFGFMTPLGILFGSGLQSFLKANTGHIMESLFQAIAAGTFLYIATFNHVDTKVGKSAVSKLTKINSLGAGIAIMAVLALWL